MARLILARTGRLLAALTAAGLLIAGCSGSEVESAAEGIDNGLIGQQTGGSRDRAAPSRTPVTPR